MDLKEYIKIFKRRKLIVFLTFCVVFSIYIYIVVRQPQKYRATSTIMLRTPSLEERLFASISGIGAGRISLDTQMQLMTSRSIAKKIAQEIQKKYKVKVSPGEIISGRRISRVANTNIIQIDIQGTDEEKVRLIANEYAEVTVEENRRLAQIEFTNATKYIKRKMKQYQKRLAQAEENLREFNKKHGVIDFNSDLMARIDRLSNYQMRREQVEMERQEIMMTVNNLRKRLQNISNFTTTTTVIPNPVLQEYKSQLLPLEMQMVELQQQYTINHPKVKSLQQKIDALRRKMKTQVAKYVEVPSKVSNPTYSYLSQSLINQEMNLPALQIRDQALQSFIEKEQKQLSTLSSKELEYTRILREKNTAERLYSALQDMLEQMRVSEIMKGGNAEVLDLATTAFPLRRTDIQKVLLMLLISIFSGISIGVVIDLMDDTISNTFRVKRYLNLPVLGSIPQVLQPRRRLLHQVGLKSPLAEVFNKISFQIQQICQEGKIKNILITSAKSEEGKSTVLLNMAISLAYSGERVIIVDADLRRPNLHRLLDMDNTVGISSILSGEIEAEAVVENLKNRGTLTSSSLEEIVGVALKSTNIENLYFLPSGPIMPNPVQLLRQDRLKEVVKIIQQKGDFIFYDSPPLNAVIDATVIGSYLDAITLVIDADSTKRSEALQAKQLLSSLKFKILGVVLNNLSLEEEEGYYHYYYQKRYGGARVRSLRH